MKNWKSRNRMLVGTSAALLISVYVISYLMLSMNGYYRPQFFGAYQGPNDTTVMAPKFGYDWMPHNMDAMESAEINMVIIGYLPLLKLDRECWHTRERAGTMKYPIRDYFDWGCYEYRDYTPN